MAGAGSFRAVVRVGARGPFGAEKALAKSAGDANSFAAMLRFRALIAALLLAGWLPALNWCALAAAFPGTLVDCCAQVAAPDQSPGGAEDDCETCATLENGFSPASLQPATLAAPTLLEEAWLTESLRALATPVDVMPPVFGAHSPPPAAGLWHFLARTAAPVRGPSLAA